MSRFTLITGGARSGKSTFAELLAAKSPFVLYIATAQVLDQEMADRVAQHRRRRPEHWQLIEEPFYIEEVLAEHRDQPGTILLDCITLWLSNLLLSELPVDAASANDGGGGNSYASYGPWEEKILDRVEKVAQLAASADSPVIFVTNEVGAGIVPDNYLSRFYRDLAGKANQILARFADEVFVVIAGYPLEIKHSGQELLNSRKGEEF